MMTESNIIPITAEGTVPEATSVIFVHPKSLLGDLVLQALSSRHCIEVVAHVTAPEQVEPEILPRNPHVALIAGEFGESQVTGIEMMRRIRGWTLQSKTILLYNNPTRETVVNAFAAGARGILNTANADLDILFRCVMQVAAGQIWANQSQVNWVVDALATRSTHGQELALIGPRFGGGLLTQREMEIVTLLSEGNTNRKIALALKISEHTVKNYLLRVFEKLGVSSRTELVVQAMNPRWTRQKYVS